MENKQEEREEEEQRQKEGRGQKWISREMRGKKCKKAKQQEKIRREERSTVRRERKKSREVGDRADLKYSADSQNTRIWPSQLENSAGEIHLILQETLKTIPVHSSDYK